MPHGPLPPSGRPASSRPTSRWRPEETLLRGALTGIALVTAATLALALAGAVIAFVIALLY